MANKIKWGAYEATLADLLTTQLDALANGSYSAAGTEQDTLHQYGDFQLDVTYGSAPSATGYVGLFLVQAVDGTNYQDGGGAVPPPATCWVANFPLRAVTTAQKIAARGILLPVGKWKAVLLNGAGQAMSASGHTLKYRAYNDEVQ